MPFVKQLGILDSQSDASCDGDVIMAAAIVGHAYTRLKKNLNCAFDAEKPLKTPLPGSPEAAQAALGWSQHVAAVAAINLALCNAKDGPPYGKPGGGKEAVVGITPEYGANGVVRITGGSGDLPLNSPLRYNPPAPATKAALDLLALATAPAVPGQAGAPPVLPVVVGYQGLGAYTGFVDGRPGGQSNLFSTYRHVIPADAQSRRWIPSVPPGGVALGTNPDQKIWGMIKTNAFQVSTLLAQNMYFQDKDGTRNHAVTLTNDMIVGYTHGMIQAIYDVNMHAIASPGLPPGIPYEIAMGVVAGPPAATTTKLASCICCAVFMEATGYPASATHLGHADCWAPLYPENPDGKSPPDMGTAQNTARNNANQAWASYCKTILTAGISLIENNLKDDAHKLSFAKLKSYVGGLQPMGFANLILDAVTLCENETTRINRTLAAAPH